MNDIELKRHSLAHIMASAVLKLYPNAKFGVGPNIENGFYYDIDFLDSSIPQEKLLKIEKEMKSIISKNEIFEKSELNIDEAIKLFQEKNQDYKVELLRDLKEKGTTSVSELEKFESVEKVSLYKTGDFIDLCRGPHIESTKGLKITFKLTKISGAYWRGNEKNKMLTRIYGLAFETQEELDNYIKLQEEAEKRDHRKIGKELGLFVFSDLVGPGLPIYTPKGAIIRREIIKYSNDLQYNIGYQEVHTPNMNKAELFKVSGHYDKYKEDMLRVVSNYSEEEYFLKPMNCPQHTQVYASQIRSYKDLPLRLADFSNLYRDEKPGELNGLTRLRCFCQDDGHSFCREDQIEEEFSSVLCAIKKAMVTYGMTYKIRLSLWDPKCPEKYLGDANVWEKSQKLLEEILIKNNIEYVKAEGEAAIYGPKMDLISHDSLDRKWQISTIQLDFIMPQRFKLTYIDNEGKEKTPVMVHRAIVGSPERFLGILIEHYAGAFPLWLSPIQVKIISVGESHIEYCKKLAEEFKSRNIRVEIDESSETVGNKIRKSAGEKNPYALVIGDKEMNSSKLFVKVRGQQDLLEIEKEEFINSILEKIKNRSLEI